MSSTSDIAKFIAENRIAICPRTSYVSVSDMYIVNKDVPADYISNFQKHVLSTGEFTGFQHSTSFAHVNNNSPSGHVLVAFGEFNNIEDIRVLATLLGSRKTILGFVINNYKEEELTSVASQLLQHQPNLRWKVQLFGSNKYILSLSLPTTEDAGAKGGCSNDTQFEFVHKGFNKQPAVDSRQQFRFLWSKATTNKGEQATGSDHGMQRVLQRISSKKGQKEINWERLIASIISSGQNDYHIYSIIRDYYFKSKSQLGGDDEGAWDRSASMVKDALSNLPSRMIGKIKTLLDYGCAEGSLTAPLGKHLRLNPTDVFGADVRVIQSPGFTFVHLKQENPLEPSCVGDILPNISNKSMDLITVSMVMHHVIHPEIVLLELRRVISDHGCLVLREHHCSSDEMGAFLDITHGLYSLSWSEPVEWPSFLNEYKASYRSREEWTNLIVSCGFKLQLPENNEAKKLYNYHDVAMKQKADGTFINVIKAYYAVYIPDLSFDYKMSAIFLRQQANINQGNNMASSTSKKRSHEMLESSTSAPRVGTDTSTDSEKECEVRDVWESTKAPGHYYCRDPVDQSVSWVTLFDSTNPSNKKIGKFFLDGRSGQKITARICQRF